MLISQFDIDDRHYVPDAWVLASRKRLYLALYVDFLLVGSIWALIQYLVLQFVPEVGDLPAWGRWTLFGLFELTVFRFDAPSLGAAVLSMRRFSYRGAEHRGKPVRGRPWFVDAWVKRSETWLQMIVALLFVSDGVKSAIRWTMWNPPQPFFGGLLNEFSSAIAYVGMGALEVVIGYLLFRLHRRAIAGAIAYTAGQLASIVASWDLWDAYVAELITRREVYLGTGRAAKRIQAFQAITPELFVVASALLLGLLTILAFRHRKLTARPKDFGNSLSSPR